MTISAPLAKASNIVFNPGFEQGSLGWTIVNDPDNQFIMIGLGNAHTGLNDAENQCSDAATTNCLTLSGPSFYQDLPTVIGLTYNLSVWAFFEGFAVGQPDELKVTWGGVTALDIMDPAVPNDVYAQYSAPNLLATTSTTRLQFFGRQDTNISLGVDDIVVATPEPSTLLLISAALLMLAGLRWHARLTSAAPVAVLHRIAKQ